jgi:hypothetical protein
MRDTITKSLIAKRGDGRIQPSKSVTEDALKRGPGGIQPYTQIRQKDAVKRAPETPEERNKAAKTAKSDLRPTRTSLQMEMDEAVMKARERHQVSAQIKSKNASGIDRHRSMPSLRPMRVESDDKQCQPRSLKRGWKGVQRRVHEKREGIKDKLQSLPAKVKKV